MGTRIRAAVLDLDGTLVDTPNAIATITARILDEMGRPATEAEIRGLVGKPLDRNFAQLLRVPPEHEDVAHAIGRYRELFGKHVRQQGRALLYPGVAEGLARLRERGLLLAIATSKVYEAAVKTVAATGIAELFDVIAGHDSVTRGKPEPDMAVYAAGKLGVPVAECVGVGDGVGDMEMGRAAGMVNIGVTYGVATEAELRAAGANVIAHSFTEVVELLPAGIAVEEKA
ncbi:HAD family hydrolase [Phytohabitans aurantiacus]|jgi:phosphoglycolate phosphatase|uniref:Hydrolase n=1 Tax=Phytohabitans aurantiacus TaxID=3016789 RepID=A0ABQ5QZT5_9ACTN|nr:HAD family hydrolase [Phytohabitans aurantiacus]GLH99954.1 hydrolase [Phytohabitans aurantiacus]